MEVYDRKRGFERVSKYRWDSDKGDSPLEIDEIKLPMRATRYSAGYDVYSTMDFVLNPNEEIKMPLGWKVYMNADECLLIIPRSGLGFKYYSRLANSIGLIDSDFYSNSSNEGHCWIKIRNEGKDVMTIKRGDAVAQSLFINYLIADGDDFKFGKERSGGFGSTG